MNWVYEIIWQSGETGEILTAVLLSLATLPPTKTSILTPGHKKRMPAHAICLRLSFWTLGQSYFLIIKVLLHTHVFLMFWFRSIKRVDENQWSLPFLPSKDQPWTSWVTNSCCWICKLEEGELAKSNLAGADLSGPVASEARPRDLWSRARHLISVTRWRHVHLDRDLRSWPNGSLGISKLGRRRQHRV